MSLIEYIELITRFLGSPTVKGNISTAVWALIIVCALVELSSFKPKPITWALKKIGAIMTSDISKRVANLEKRQEKSEQNDELEKVLQARRRILRTNDELLNNGKHTKDYFVETLDDIALYEEYCKRHSDPNDPMYFRNGRCPEAIMNVRRVFRQLERTNGFLSVKREGKNNEKADE